MRFFGNGFAAFQPPSDMQGSGGASSGKKKLFVGLGIGCGVILLLVGILFAAGAFKAVSCCTDMKDLAETSVGAREFGQSFADRIHSGELDEAYAMTSASFQGATSVEAFSGAVEAHRERMKSNAPRMFDMQLKTVGEPDSLDSLKTGSWNLTYQFAGPSDETMLLLTFRVDRATGDEADEGGFHVDDVRFDERPRNLAAEPPAEEVLKFHDLIQRGSYEVAYSRLAEPFQKESDFETFRKFLEDSGDILQRSDIRIREVAYNEANTQATVMVHAKSEAGSSGIVQYELTPMQPDMPGFGWRIVTIAPLIAQQAAPEAAPSTGTNAAEVDAGTPTNNLPVVIPPTVDVTP